MNSRDPVIQIIHRSNEDTKKFKFKNLYYSNVDLIKGVQNGINIPFGSIWIYKTKSYNAFTFPQ